MIPDIEETPLELDKEPTVRCVELNTAIDPTSEDARALLTAEGAKHSTVVSLKKVVDKILEA